MQGKSLLFLFYSNIILEKGGNVMADSPLIIKPKENDYKKNKIIIGVFSILILVTIIIFVVGAILSYNYDAKNNFDDKWFGFDIVLIIMIGGFVVFYELDLFYAVYYFFVKPKTMLKSILNVVSNLTLLSMFFTNSIAYFFFKYVSKVFGEEIIMLFLLFFTYVILRTVCCMISVREPTKEN